MWDTRQRFDVFACLEFQQKVSEARGGRDNGPHADSFPLRCHFHGGGGGGGARGGRGGGGGAPHPYIYGAKWPPHRADHFEVQM